MSLKNGVYLFLFVTTCCLTPFKATGNDLEVIDLNRLVRHGVISISSNWKFMPGDSLNWALPTYDDTHWSTSRSVTEKSNLDSLMLSGWDGIGWYRKRIFIDSSLSDLNLATTLYQRAATEVYIDGELWKQFGKVSSDQNKERLYRNLNFFMSPFELGKEYVVAVRVSNHRMNHYVNNNTYGGFSLIISEFEKMLAQDRANLMSIRTSATIIVTLTGGFFLLHFLMFLFYPKDKTNLFYALGVGCLSLATYFSAGQLYTTNSDELVLFSQIEIVFVVIFHLLFLLLAYTFFNIKLGKVFWSILLLSAFYASYCWFSYESYPKILSILNYFVYADIIRVLYFKKSRKTKSSSSWILTLGVTITIVIISIVNFFLLGFGDIKMMLNFANYYAVLPLMISMSVFQARDLAKNNEVLEYRLTKINMLSDQNLKQAKRELDLRIESEKQKTLFQEAEYRAKVAELQSRSIAQENERKSKELEEARTLQLSMLPKKLPEHGYLSFAAHMLTAYEVGGDYYDFIKQEDDSLIIAIGDATGHGLSAGTMVTTVKSLLRGKSIQSLSDIPKAFHSMTNVIRDMNFKKIFMSLTLARIQNHTLEISAAGMPPLMIYKSESNSIERVTLKGMPLGSARNFNYQTAQIPLKTGDILLFASDGITELFNHEKDMFGHDRIENCLCKNASKSPSEIISILLSVAKQWQGDTVQHDDITLVAIKVVA